ncbi:hypothetical protein QAD02_022240 [Eretmocerus hayati]|uniref:Uncharacterized protein n=1 Tax=Eretmocerus hayati TaxID=131215 RepID=A0ACC2PU25_9HYME|nr:hypothetical protein QAD02_022240 [Eretmocerus hayati]
MEVEDVDMPASLPDTQNADSQAFTQSQDTMTPAEATPQPRIWGRLCPHDSAFPSMVLKNDKYTFGRLPNCDIPVKGRMKPRYEAVVSKIHFIIYRDICITSDGLEEDVVYLRDESANGTYVNSKLIGKGNCVILVNNDLIAVAKVNINVYVYMSTSGYDNSFLPEELRSKYAVSRKLGSGACGEVKMCFSKCDSAGKKFAMKMIKKVTLGSSGPKNHPNDEKHILNEVAICQALKHPCIIKIEDFHDCPSMVYIILELMEGGELFERIKKNNGLTEENAKFIFYQVVLAVNYLHEHGITHRDLKPENILLANGDDETIVKVSDFGLSKLVDSQTMMKTFCGTPMYVAPEILLTGGRGSYTKQVDVWSLGVILYCCLSGLTPFKVHDKTYTLHDQIVRGMYNFHSSKFFKVSSAAKDLIKRMMTVDPNKRITIQKVMEHPWLNDPAMLNKVHNLLGLSNSENVLPKKTMCDNIPPNAPKQKRARLE